MMTKFAGKNLKRTAALLLCSVALVLPALAQSGTTDGGGQQGPPPGGGGRRGGGGPEQRLEMMTKALNLTADQTVKIKAILEDGRAKMMAERQSSASQEDRRAKMMEMMKTENASIKAVLTDEQKTKFEEMEKRQRERMREGGGGGNGPPPPPPAAPQQ